MAEYISNWDRTYRLKLILEQTGQNLGANTSSVRARLYLLSGNGAYNNAFSSYSINANVVVDGQTLTYSGTPNVTYNANYLLIDKTVNVTHNSDGRKSFGFSAKLPGPGGYAPSTLSISGNFSLTTIPRSSTVNSFSGVIGSPVTININRQSSSFTHTLRYSWGSKSGTIANGVGTSTTWTIPSDFANDLPDGTTGTGTIFIDTYNGGTKTGTQSVTFTASIPSVTKPTFTGVTLTDTNGVVRGLLSGNNFLQIISNIQVTFNGAKGSYGSTIVGYRAEIVNKGLSTNQNGGTLGIMNFSGSATIRASVLDSRGKWSDTKDVTINVLEYFAPILSFQALRTRETPNIIQIVRNARIAPVTLSGSQKNVMTLSFKVAQVGTTNYTADTGSASGTWTTINSLTNSAANMAGNYPTTKSFTVVGTLSDKFTSTEFSVTVATESVVMSYDKDGRVGIGKVVERGKAGSLDVAGDIYANGKLVQMTQLTTPSGGGWPYERGRDMNTVKTAGIFQGDQYRNAPTPEGAVIYTGQENGAWGEQLFIDRQNGRLFTRTLKDNTWGKWIEFINSDTLNQTVNAISQSISAVDQNPLLNSTPWTPTGEGNCDYKVVGGVVYCRINNIPLTAGKSQSIGKIPYPPSINSMFLLGDWSVYDDHVKLQLNNDGGGAILGSSIKTSRNLSAFFSYPIA